MKTALDLTPQTLSRARRFLELAPQRGLLPSLLAATALLPERACGTASLDDLVERVTFTLRERCERLFVRAPAVVRPEDLEDARDRGALLELADAVANARDSDDAEPGERALPLVVGEIAGDRVAALLFDLRDAPLGAVTPWLFACELLGTTLVYRATRSDALAGFRATLAERLSGFVDQSPEVFAQRLVSGDEPALERSASFVADALRGAAALAFVPA